MGMFGKDDAEEQPLRPPIRSRNTSRGSNRNRSESQNQNNNTSNSRRRSKNNGSNNSNRNRDNPIYNTPPITPVARMPVYNRSNLIESSSESEEDESLMGIINSASVPKTTLERRERITRMVTPGAIDPVRQQRQISGEYSAEDDENDTLIIDSEYNDEPPLTTFLPQESALHHSIVAELAPDDDSVQLAARVADRVEANLVPKFKEEVEARLSQHVRQQQYQQELERRRMSQMHPIVKAEPLKPEGEFNDEESSEKKPSSKQGSTSCSKTSEDDDDDNFRICGLKRRCWGILLAILGVLIIAAVFGAYTFVKNLDMDPTEPPTNTPTPSPTARPTDYSFREELLDLIGDSIAPTEDDLQILNDVSSPQSQALDWMSTDDKFSTELIDSTSSSSSPPSFLNQTLTERYALAVLYFSTNGPISWKKQFNFLKPTASVCEWHDSMMTELNNDEGDPNKNAVGVLCVYDRNITNSYTVNVVDLANNGLQGKLPWEISLLNNLSVLYLDGNYEISGTLPTRWSALTNLENMWLERNSLTGNLPYNFDDMTSLASVSLRENQLTGQLPENWGRSMSNLYFLSLGLNQFEGYLPDLWGGMTSLRGLDLEDNDLDGRVPSEIGKLTLLEELFLEMNFFTGPLPSEMGLLTGLKEFLVHENQMTGTIPTTFQKLGNLTTFYFHSNLFGGSVDEILCIDGPLVPNTKADCGGNPPEIVCSCCLHCCTFDGDLCR